MDNKEMERNEEMVTENTVEETMEYDNIQFEKDAKVTVEDTDGNVIAEAKPTYSVDEDGSNEEAEEKKSKSEQEEIELVKRLKTTTQIQQNSK